MKTKFLFLALLFTFQTKAQVPYVSFDLESSVWSEFFYSNFFYNEYIDVGVDGDTIIDNQTWQKLHKQGMAYYYSSPNQYEITDSMVIDEYLGALRENDQKQLLYLPNGQTEPSIMYDFNFEIGDTIELMDYGVSPLSAIVLSGDTVELCGVLRNRYFLQFVDPAITNPILIEGIGSASGLVPRFELFESGGYLQCYSRVNCACGEQLVNVFERPEQGFEFTIFPNPANDAIRLESDTELVRLEIYDGFGRLVLNSTSQSDIDISKLNQGVYFCKVKDVIGNVSIRKVVKE